MNAQPHPLEPLILQLIDDRISASDLEVLQESMLIDEELRQRYVELCGLEFDLRSLELHGQARRKPGPNDWRTGFNTSITWALATAAILLVIAGAYALIRPSESGEDQVAERDASESRSQYQPAFARSVRTSGVEWSNGSTKYHRNDIIRGGDLAVKKGELQIDFFSGTSMFVKGPTRFSVQSDWRIRLAHGRCRFRVPPEAKGFTVEIGDWEVIDLGTEFTVNALATSSVVHVLEGSVELRSPDHQRTVLTAGQSQRINREPSSGTEQGSGSVDESRRFDQWNLWSNTIRNDPDLIAYYPIVRTGSVQSEIPNASQNSLASTGLVGNGVNSDVSRFFNRGRSLNFTENESGLRFSVDGRFESVTLVCWARIDALPHVYNGLLLTDEFDPGEIHWHFSRQGELNLFVMAGTDADAKRLRTNGDLLIWEQPWHRMFRSPPVWTEAQSGTWMHLATVIDTKNRLIRLYVNGQQVAEFDRIGKVHLLDFVSIGAAEFGNWGKPYATKFYFAQRNLQGAIDEAMIFKRSLTVDEIESIYRNSKPFEYP